MSKEIHKLIKINLEGVNMNDRDFKMTCVIAVCVGIWIGYLLSVIF